MATKFDDAVAELYRAPHGEFVSERKRLANELTRAGDKPAAALFAKLPRPSISAWATNQLFWEKRSLFDAFFASAARLRAGDLDAAVEHRKQSTSLVNQAAEILKSAGHAASEATLRRIAANVAALAAAGSFEPDPPGALKSDRDPPGFDAFAFGGAETTNTPHRAEAARAKGRTAGVRPETAEKAEAARASAEAARTRASVEAERRRAAEVQARARAERRELETALRTAKTAVERRTKERDRLQRELATVESELEQALASERELTERLAQLASD